VDDARFETLVVKQTKQTVLEEARSKANGKWIGSNKWVTKIAPKRVSIWDQKGNFAARALLVD